MAIGNNYQYTAIPFSEHQIMVDQVEPFVAWTRLVGRPKEHEFSKALRAQTHDALWYIGKQWQLGEFKGENAGTPISVKASVQHRSLTHFAGKDDIFSTLAPIPEDIPLEVMVEAMNFKLDLKQLADIGRFYVSLLREHDVSEATISALNMSEEFGFMEVTDVTVDNWSKDIENTKKSANIKTKQLLSTLLGRVPDGWKVYESILVGGSDLASIISSADLSSINTRYKNWVENLYQIPVKLNWDEEKMEYRFRVGAARMDGASIVNDVFTADDYSNGKLNWHSVDRDLSPENATFTNPPNVDQDYIKTDLISMVPRPATFPGMPKKRFWEMEDAKIDFAALEGDLSEVIKSAIAEYALVYSNDWFIVPYDLKVGTLSKVNGITVKDVFGEVTLINSAIGQSPVVNDDTVDLWARWNMFGLDTLKKNDFVIGTDTNPKHTSNPSKPELYIPSTIYKGLESEPIEKISFVRDELDNYVWAVEDRVFDLGCSSRDGKISSNELELYLRKLLDNQEITEDHYAKLVYKLGSSVNENWIPFIPVRPIGEQRSIRLQRASLPRTYDENLSKIRPVTSLLRKDIDNKDSQLSPMFINEEIIPRVGMEIIDAYQRVRWYNGKTYLWYGRKKKIGKSSFSSGLNFDNLEYKSADEIVTWEGAEGIDEMIIQDDLIIDTNFRVR